MRGADLHEALGWGHERVHFVSDRDSGLEAVIAIHSTVLGPALGGMRLRAYPGGLPEALDDALRLSRAMTLKASAAGLELGGGKAVVLDDGDAGRREERLLALAAEIDRLGGDYITAEDIGTTTADMDLIASRTDHVVGRSDHDGIGGDPSPATARTVFEGLRSALRTVDGDDDPGGRAVAVIGLGKVGGRLAGRLHAEGARVLAFDPDPETAATFAAAGVEIHDSVDSLLAEEVDVLAPCAVGGMIDAERAARLRCRIVCGAANNPLGGEGTDALLASRGILYVPDFLANSGGLIHVDAERRHRSDAADIEHALDDAAARTEEVLRTSWSSGTRPAIVAEEMAQARIFAAARPRAASVH